VLLDHRLGGGRLQCLDIGGYVQWLDIGKLADPMLLEPAKEVAYGPVFLLRIWAAKNSRKRLAAWSPAPMITAGTAIMLRAVDALTGSARHRSFSISASSAKSR
jgi:hypothetical protein